MSVPCVPILPAEQPPLENALRSLNARQSKNVPGKRRDPPPCPCCKRSYAHQKPHGIASPVVRALAAGGDRPKPKHGGPAHVEVSLGQQVLMLVRKGGTVARAIHISSGAGGKTPAGDFGV